MEQCANIFQPRKAYIVDEKTGETKQCDYITPVGIKEYDKYYIKRQIKFVPKPISDGSDEYVLEMKVIDDLEDIKESINTAADGVGLDALMEKFTRTGDISVLPPQMKPTDEVMDFTKLPQDNAEYFEYIHSLADKFKSIPVELRGDMTVEDFVRNITQKQVDDYMNTLMAKEDKKDE